MDVWDMQKIAEVILLQYGDMLECIGYRQWPWSATWDTISYGNKVITDEFRL